MFCAGPGNLGYCSGSFFDANELEAIIWNGASNDEIYVLLRIVLF